MRIAVLIDYDNLLPSHQHSGILDVSTKALMRTELASTDQPGHCDIRIYGGWYEGSIMTPRAQDLAAALQASFPSLVTIPDRTGALKKLVSNASLAVSLLEDPRHHLFDTFRSKGKPANIRVKKPVDVGCQDERCPLPMAKKILKTGKCPSSSCVTQCNDIVYRGEQKLVDTMLTCDMLYAPAVYDSVVLISGDDDFIPPLRVLLANARGRQVTRFHPKPNIFKKPVENHLGRITEMDL